MLELLQMNSIENFDEIGLDYKQNIKQARRLYRKNLLKESLSIISKLRHHGYNEPELLLFMEKVCWELSLLTSDIEYESMALEAHTEIINYSNNKRYIKKADKLQKHFLKKISPAWEDAHKALSKANELQISKPKSPKAWFMLGANFTVRQNPQFVISAYSNAVRLNDKYISALYRIGYIYQYNLNDKTSALSYYLKAIKIQPHEDEIESESTNVKIIIEACTEVSAIYLSEKKYNKVISAFDHAFKLFVLYSDICTLHTIKKIIGNTYSASKKLNNIPALKKHVRINFGYDLDALLQELRII
jgi:tetratricopeptide (TPR) repeat protein